MARHRKQSQSDLAPRRELSQLLREVRQASGQSIKTAGPELGVNYSYLSKIENGKVVPSADLLKRMAALYQADADELFAAAGRLPLDVEKILSTHRGEAVRILREAFGP